MHDAGIEFDNPFFIRETAVTNAGVVRVFLDDVDPSNDGVERIAPGSDDFNDFLAAGRAVVARYGDVFVQWRGNGWERAGGGREASLE